MSQRAKQDKEKYTWKQIWIPPILGAIAIALLFYMIYWHLKQKRDRRDQGKQPNIEFPADK